MESSQKPSEFMKPPVTRPFVRLSFAKRADAATLARTLLLAFENDKNTPAFAPDSVGLTTAELLSRDGPLEERHLRRKLVGNDIYIKASVQVKDDLGNEEEKIVGWASWSDPTRARRRSIRDWLWSKVIYPLYQFLFRPRVVRSLPPEVKELFLIQHNAVFGPGGVAEGRKHWHLHVLVVDPQWQGLGIGGALMNWGFERAREDDAAIYLESSIVGLPIYLAKGFRVVSAETCHVNGFHIKIPGMIWEPRMDPASRIGSQERIDF